MHHSSRVVRRPQPFTVRTVVAMIAAAVLALLTVACGGGSSSGSGGSSSTGGSSNARSAEPFSVCMRSHGVSRYPDPDPKTPGFPALVRSARSVGVSAATLQAAERACYRTLPIDASKLDSRSLAQCEYTGDCPRALVQQAMTQLENFARCMRSHGCPGGPTPPSVVMVALASRLASVKMALTRIGRRFRIRRTNARGWSTQTSGVPR